MSSFHFCCFQQKMYRTAEGQAELQEELDSDAGVSRAMAELYTVEQRIPLLMIHSLLHLVGYDHDKESQWKTMTKKEQKIIDIFNAKWNKVKSEP